MKLIFDKQYFISLAAAIEAAEKDTQQLVKQVIMGSVYIIDHAYMLKPDKVQTYFDALKVRLGLGSSFQNFKIREDNEKYVLSFLYALPFITRHSVTYNDITVVVTLPKTEHPRSTNDMKIHVRFSEDTVKSSRKLDVFYVRLPVLHTLQENLESNPLDTIKYILKNLKDDCRIEIKTWFENHIHNKLGLEDVLDGTSPPNRQQELNKSVRATHDALKRLGIDMSNVPEPNSKVMFRHNMSKEHEQYSEYA